MLTLTPSQFKDLQRQAGRTGMLVGVPKTTKLTVKARGLRQATMTRDEQRYADYLSNEQHAGRVFWYQFEAVKLVLSRSQEVQPDGSIKTQTVSYTPDFAVVDSTCLFSLREVKGTTYKTLASGVKAAKPYAEADAIVKLKVAACLFPFSFHLVHQAQSGEWLQINY